MHIDILLQSVHYSVSHSKKGSVRFNEVTFCHRAKANSGGECHLLEERPSDQSEVGLCDEIYKTQSSGDADKTEVSDLNTTLEANELDINKCLRIMIRWQFEVTLCHVKQYELVIYELNTYLSTAIYTTLRQFFHPLKLAVL